MKRITTFFLSLLLSLVATTAMADTFEDGYMVKVGEPATQLEAGKYYLLYSLQGGYIYDSTSGKGGHPALYCDTSINPEGAVANDMKDYLVTLEDGIYYDDSYYIKYANNDYIYIRDHWTSVWSWSYGTEQYIFNVCDTEDCFQIEDAIAGYPIYLYSTSSYCWCGYEDGDAYHEVTSMDDKGYIYQFIEVEIVEPYEVPIGPGNTEPGEWSEMRATKLDSYVNSIVEDQWYMIYCKGSNSSYQPAYWHENTRYVALYTQTASTVETQDVRAEDLAPYLVRFIPSGEEGQYYVQLGTGNYLSLTDDVKNSGNLKNAQVKVSSDIVDALTVYSYYVTWDDDVDPDEVKDDEYYMAFNVPQAAGDTASWRLAAYGSDNYVYLWNSGQASYDSNMSNHFWIYPVEFTDPYAEGEDTDSDYHEGDVVTVDGVEYTVLDDNEIENHSFELGFEGWTKASDFTTTIDEDFELLTDDPQNGLKYLVGTSTSGVSGTAGAAGTSSLGTAWPIEAGETYMFTYWIKQQNEGEELELNYLKVSLTDTPGTETKVFDQIESLGTEWQMEQIVFTNDEGYDYLQIDFRWLKGRYGFDNFSLHKVVEESTEKTVTYTDNLHVMLGSDDEGVQEATVDVEYTASDVINFTLHGLAVSTYNVGDVTVNDIQLEDAGDGVYTFSYSGTDVSVSGGDFDDLIRMVTITVNLTGEISADKLRANMTVTVTMFGMSLLNVTADFGYSYNDYLVVNAESGYFLGGGLDWGTHATELGKPQFFTFGEQADGTYKLNGHQDGSTSIGWDADYLGIYIDAANPLTWTVTEVDGGYTISCDEGYLTGNGFQEAVTLKSTAGSTAVWKFVTKDEILASMADASADNPVDVTALIPAPEPKRNNWGGSWVATGYGVSAEPANYSLGQDWNTANCAESWHSSNGFDIRQTIPSLPAGHYILNAQAFHDGSPSVVPVMYVDDETTRIPSLTTSAYDMESAYQEFLQELHTVSMEFDVEADDTDVLVGFSSLLAGDNEIWTIFGELELLYTGEAVAEEPEPLEPGDVAHECVAEVDHWTIAGNTNGDFHYNDWSVETDPSGMVVPLLEYWVGSWEGNLSAATISHETLTDLPAGSYEVSLDVRIFSEAGNEIGEGTTLAANDASVDVVAAGTADVYGTETEVYGTYVLTCTVDEDGTLDISLDIPEGVEYNWIAFKNLSVTYLGEVEEPETLEPGDVAHECVAEVDHWTIAGNTNGDFHYNDWSVETDPSGMVVPLLEYWVWSGEGNLSAATISHETLTDLPAGTYEVSLDVRIFSEAGNEISAGTTLNANDASVDLWVEGTDGTYGTETEVYGTYVLTCTVDEDGTLDISIDIPSGVSYNWIAFKNLTVTYVGEEVVADNSYQFVCTDWSSIDTGRVTNDNISYDEDANTITVNAGTGANNVALSNGLSEPFTTADYTVSSEQNWYVVVASNISTDLTASQLWWMNGDNDGGSYTPDYIVELESGEILIAWDLSATGIDTYLQDDENYLDGWTGFGLTSTTGTSVVSDINFYTWREAVAKYPELATAIATEIESVETAGTELAKEGIYTLSGVRLNKITKSGIYIVDGKKVLVK